MKKSISILSKNLYFRFLLLIFFIFLNENAFSQTKDEASQKREIEKQDAKIKELSQKFAKQYQEQQAQIKAYCEKNKIPMYETRNGIYYWIERIENGKPVYYQTRSNVGSSATIRANRLNTGGSLGLTLNGQNMEVDGTRNRLGMWEPNPTRTSHQEFQSRVTQRDVAAYTGAGSSGPDHAAHVAGTMVAGGVDANAKGMAWQAKMDAYDASNNLAEMTAASTGGMNGSMLVSNHSYGPSFATAAGDIWKRGYYDQGAADWDAFAIASPYHLSIQAIGNDRDETAIPIVKYDILMGESNAKNFLGVGAIEMITGTAQNYTQASDAVMSDFSSFGPTDDGRIKPEVVAAGVGIYSAKSATDATYGTSQGTSMAAPAVTAALFLVQQHQKNLTGGFMKAASLKAMAIHNVDETGTTEGPDYAFGFGLLNVEKMVKFLNNDGRNHFWTEQTLANAGNYTKAIKTSGGKSLKVTISWNDPAAVPLANDVSSLDNRTSRLVNDLDVRIKKADGTDLALPWKLDPANPANAATRGDNLVDNIEQISFDNVPAGNYTVTVTHKGTLGASQDFSIMISGISQIEVEQNTAFISTNSGSYNFGNVNVGANSGDISFTVKNTGSTPLLLSNFQINGTDATMFTSVNFVTTTINAAANTTFSLKFTPTSAGAKTAFITIGNNSTNENPYTFTVNGTGVAVGTTTPFISVKQNVTLIPNTTGTYNFGNLNIGSNSGMINFTVDNQGTAPLELSNFQITGANASMFTTTNFITTTVNGGANTTFGLQFAPTSGGVKFATVSIGNNVFYSPAPNTFSNYDDVTNGLTNNVVFAVYASGGTIYAGTSGGALSASTDGGTTFAYKNISGAVLTVNALFADGGTFYAGTNAGLAISTDGGNTFNIRNNANSGLGVSGFFEVLGIYASGSTIYAATTGGLSISTNGGTTFNNRNIINSGLVNDNVRDVYISGGTIYAATGANGALSISTDGGNTFTNRTMANGLGGNNVGGVCVNNGIIYAATASTTGGGLSFSTDGGTTFVNKTTTNGLGSNSTSKVYVDKGVIYVATDGGLSFSTDGGTTFANRNAANGLGNSAVNGLFLSNGKAYVATSGGVSIGDLPTTPYTFTVTGTGAEPFISVKQTANIGNNGSHNFGNVNVGANSGDITFTVDNTGAIPLNLSNFQINGANAGDFTTTNFVNTSINAAGNTTFTIKFTPSGAGAKTAFITIGNNSTVNPYTFTVNGTGTVQPFISVKQNVTPIPNSTGSYNFGNIAVNTNSGMINFTVDNQGNAPLELSNFQINGTDAAMFTTTNFITTTVNGGSNTTFGLQFAPTSTGTKTAFISIGNNVAGLNPYTFTVNGTGTEPFISVKQGATVIANSTGTHNFGNVALNSNSGDITFTVENTGTANLNLTSFQINGANAGDFTTTNFVNTSINAAGNTTFTIKFTPSSAGAKIAFITIGNNSTVNPYTFTVNGTGVASPLIAVKQGANAVNHTGVHNFGNVNVNANSGNITFTIENAGTATLNLETFQLNGTNGGEFTTTNFVNASINAAGNTTFTIKFSPTSAGQRTAFITINSDATPNAYTFTLQGTGVALTTANQPTTPTPPTNNNQNNTVITPVVVQNVVFNGQNVAIAPTGQSTVFVTAQPLRFDSQLDFTLPQGFTLVPFEANKATVSNGKITLKAVGQIKLTIIKPDGTFSSIILNVEKANAFITTTPNMIGFANNLTCQSPAFALPLVSNSPEKINLSVISGKAEIQNGLIKVLGTGLVKIRATQAENNNFTSAQSIDFEFNVNKSLRIFSLANLANKTFGDADFTLPNDWYSEKLTYSSESKNISISGNTVKILGAGQSVIKAFLAENDCYFASTFDLVLNVRKASQTISFSQITAKTIGDPSFPLSATASSNLPITYSILDGQNIVSLQGNQLSLTEKNTGLVTILAQQIGNENYEAAYAEQIFTVSNKVAITITSVTVGAKSAYLDINYTIKGIFSESNEFTALLSKVDGSFPTTHFTQKVSVDTYTGTIRMGIPEDIETSDRYRVKIISSNPNAQSNIFAVSKKLTPKPRVPNLSVQKVKTDGKSTYVLCASVEAKTYKWYVNGKLLPNETKSCITISADQGGRAEANQVLIYTVSTVDEEDRESDFSSPFEISTEQINLITGIESDLDLNLKVYPNPTKDFLVLDLASPSLRKIEVSIFNMLGQKVLAKSFANSQKEEVLDLQHLPSGTYLLEISNEKGKHRQQIVKE